MSLKTLGENWPMHWPDILMAASNNGGNIKEGWVEKLCRWKKKKQKDV